MFISFIRSNTRGVKEMIFSAFVNSTHLSVHVHHSLPPFSLLSAPKPYLQFVGGKACKSVSGCSLAVQSPGGSGVLAYCPDGGKKDVRNAVEAAIKVQPG